MCMWALAVIKRSVSAFFLKGGQLSAVVRELLALGNKKSYIRPSCTKTLVDLIGRVKPEVLREEVWPLLQVDLNEGWEECTPDRLILLLACHNKDKVGDGHIVQTVTCSVNSLPCSAS